MLRPRNRSVKRGVAFKPAVDVYDLLAFRNPDGAGQCLLSERQRSGKHEGCHTLFRAERFRRELLAVRLAMPREPGFALLLRCSAEAVHAHEVTNAVSEPRRLLRFTSQHRRVP